MKLYEFYCDCGRMGHLEGLFVASQEEVNNAIGNTIYFGEVLGKHSDIDVDLEEKHLKVLSEDRDKIEWLVEIMGDTSISGFNPIEMWQEQSEDEE